MATEPVQTGIPLLPVTSPKAPASLDKTFKLYYYIFGLNRYHFVYVNPVDDLDVLEEACTQNANDKFYLPDGRIERKCQAIWLKKPLTIQLINVHNLKKNSSLSIADFEKFEPTFPRQLIGTNFTEFRGDEASDVAPGDFHLVFVPTPSGKFSLLSTFSHGWENQGKRITQRKIVSGEASVHKESPNNVHVSGPGGPKPSSPRESFGQFLFLIVVAISTSVYEGIEAFSKYAETSIGWFIFL